MKPLIDLFREHWIQASIFYYRLALQQINPHHPDVPAIILSISRLQQKLTNMKEQP